MKLNVKANARLKRIVFSGSVQLPVDHTSPVADFEGDSPADGGGSDQRNIRRAVNRHVISLSRLSPTPSPLAPLKRAVLGNLHRRHKPRLPVRWSVEETIREGITLSAAPCLSSSIRPLGRRAPPAPVPD